MIVITTIYETPAEQAARARKWRVISLMVWLVAVTLCFWLFGVTVRW